MAQRVQLSSDVYSSSSHCGVSGGAGFLPVALRAAAGSRLCVPDLGSGCGGTEGSGVSPAQQGDAEFHRFHFGVQCCVRHPGRNLHRSRAVAGALQVGAGAGGRRCHHSLWAAPDRLVQDQGVVHRRAPAHRQRREHAVGSLPDRFRLRFRLDALRGPRTP